MSAPDITDAAWETLHDAFDLQVHVEPDVVTRRTDDVDLARDFLAQGLSGFVLKSHYLTTAERASVVRRAVPGIGAYGAITLNHSMGGLNPVAVDIAGRSGAQIVWFPTVDSVNEADIVDSDMPNPPVWVEIARETQQRGLAPPPITLLDDRGELSRAARDCLRVAAEYDMIVASGHVDRRETFALVRGARELGVDKVVVTHAEFPSQNFSGPEQRELTEWGALIEHCFTTAHTGKCTWETMFDNIRATSPERCVISTDLGQRKNPPVAEGYAEFVQRLFDAGFTEREVRRMTVGNPRRLLGVSEETA